jgi:hypothetical protein
LFAASAARAVADSRGDVIHAALVFAALARQAARVFRWRGIASSSCHRSRSARRVPGCTARSSWGVIGDGSWQRRLAGPRSSTWTSEMIPMTPWSRP